MKQIFFSIIFCVIAIVLVASAPEWYSFEFCSAIFALYIAQNIIFWLNRTDRNFVCFEFFFMISFGLTNFIYPVVYYPTNPDFAIFRLPFNEQIISKSTAIAFFAYSVYLLAVSKIKRETVSDNENSFVFDEKQILTLFFLTLIFFVLYSLTGGLVHLQSVYSGYGDIREVGIFSYFNNLFIIFAFLLLMFNFRQKNRRNMIIFTVSGLFFAALLLMTGSRTQVLAFGLIIVTSVNLNVRKIRLAELFVLLTFGILIMVFVVLARTSSFGTENWLATAQSEAHFNSYFDIFSDFIINGRNLYVLTDYADNIQHTYFSGMISDLTNFIPGLFAFISENSNAPVELMTGGALPTYLDIGPDSKFGLGTNMVGEAYLAFGLPGVVFFFFAIGWIVKKTEKAMNHNIYAYVIYFLFVSHSIMYPRAPILFNLRTLIWSLLIIAILLYFSKISQRNNTEPDKTLISL